MASSQRHEHVQPWHHFSEGQVLRLLASSRHGLDGHEAQRRLKRYGRNALPRRQRLPAGLILLNQLRSPVVMVLLVAVGLTATLRLWVDTAVIAAVIVVNSLIGFSQEYRAEQVFARLKDLVTYRARVRRDGGEHSIPTEALVPGDVILLRGGDRVPADARLLEVAELTVNEASLSGESLPSGKSTHDLPEGTVLADRENMVYLGTTVAAGSAVAVVCATGGATALGEITTLVQATVEPPTPLQLRLKRLSWQITAVVACLAVTVLAIGLLQGRRLLEPVHAELSLLYTAVAIGVSAIPEGMLVIVTVILAIGMQAIARRGALVNRLVATETLGSTSVICLDKTGTITEGQMRVTTVITPDGELDFPHLLRDPRAGERLLMVKIGALCNNAVVENPHDETHRWRILGDPTESALLKCAREAGFSLSELNHREPRLSELPFSSERKLMATLHRAGDRHVVYCKGAPERVLERCATVAMAGRLHPLDPTVRRQLKAKFEHASGKGLRLLGFAYRWVGVGDRLTEDVAGLTFVGFLGLKDPIRPEAPEALRRTVAAGIRTVMITGDHRLTAQAIAEESGLTAEPEQVIEGDELDRMGDAELQRRVQRVTLFARVSPKHKLRIVTAWQRRGEVVAMTGDGVNDAPALKAADIGVALNSGTDVAKETADLILLDNNFHTIVATVEQGRIIYDNIRKAVLYLLSDSFTEVVLVSGALLLNLPLPLLPLQILWINLIGDSLPAMALTLERGEAEVMGERPRRRRTQLLDAEVKTLIAIISGTISLLLFTLFLLLLERTADLAYIRTLVFTALAVDSLLYVFSVRSLRHPLWRSHLTGNPALLGAAAVGFLLQLAVLYEPHLSRIFHTVPLSGRDWLLVLGLAVVVILTIEVTKRLWFFHPSPAGHLRSSPRRVERKA